MAGVAVKDEKMSATGAPSANDIRTSLDPAGPRPEHAAREQPLDDQNDITAEPGFAGHRISGDATINSALPTGRGAGCLNYASCTARGAKGSRVGG